MGVPGGDGVVPATLSATTPRVMLCRSAATDRTGGLTFSTTTLPMDEPRTRSRSQLSRLSSRLLWMSCARWLVLALLGLQLLGSVPGRSGIVRTLRGQVRGPVGAAFDDYLRTLEAFGYSGSVLVARRGQILLNRGYGLADRRTGEPYTADTLFDVASVSKQFTAAAIIKLEEGGKLKVSDTLSRFFPTAPPDKARITLHQVLNHSAGLIDVIGPEYQPLTRDEMVRALFAAPLVSRPGKHYRYSNAGYSLLAAIVEQVSGQSLGDYLREHLFLPAGMRHTGLRLPWRDRRDLAQGYSLDGPWGTPLEHPWQSDGPYWNLRGNGGVLSTTGDLYLWHLALASDGVLSSAERSKLVTPSIRESQHTSSRYAYGWSMNEAPDGTRMASHTGSNLVFETDVLRYLDDEVMIVASSNSADYSAVSLGPHLENRYFNVRDPKPPVPIAVREEDLDRCDGKFSLPAGGTLYVERMGRGLGVWSEDREGLALLLAAQSPEELELAADREKTVEEALNGAHAGDFEPLSVLFGLPTREVTIPFKAAVQLFEHRLGIWQGAQVVGTESVGGSPYTYARLIFERGTALAQYRWTGPTAETVRHPPRPASYLFLPERVAPGPGGDTTALFGSFDVRTGAVQRLRITLPSQGPALSVVVLTPRGEVSALRAD
jgi:CubicO group peptidase (beta-lactamase class C family)